MLGLAFLCIVVGLGLVVSGISRGEWSDQRPSAPEPHWRVTVGAMVFIGGTLLTVATLAVPRLVPRQEVQNVDQPVASPGGTIEPVSTIPGIFH